MACFTAVCFGGVGSTTVGTTDCITIPLCGGWFFGVSRDGDGGLVMMVGDCARCDAAPPLPPRGRFAREGEPAGEGPVNGLRGREKGGDGAGRDGERRVMPGGRVHGWEGEKARGTRERVDGDEAPAVGVAVGDMTGEGMRELVGETELVEGFSRMKEKDEGNELKV